MNRADFTIFLQTRAEIRVTPVLGKPNPESMRRITVSGTCQISCTRNLSFCPSSQLKALLAARQNSQNSEQGSSPGIDLV